MESTNKYKYIFLPNLSCHGIRNCTKNPQVASEIRKSKRIPQIVSRIRKLLAESASFCNFHLHLQNLLSFAELGTITYIRSFRNSQ